MTFTLEYPTTLAFTATCWRRLLSERMMPPGEVPPTAVECLGLNLSHPAADVCMTGTMILE